ncbi:hypothetical protein RSSM_04224 [Rhodopirellula sallentina SM41]|uniref:Uncharacterized protein n=1 Tax=Rhodopirellula sallentina SM41 TaxID=1263870 RepID=M5TYS1_9BACT|nr:hypothetical protein RSSM_04224 [Rhodopirellula sallentina SM41]
MSCSPFFGWLVGEAFVASGDAVFSIADWGAVGAIEVARSEKRVSWVIEKSFAVAEDGGKRR